MWFFIKFCIVENGVQGQADTITSGRSRATYSSARARSFGNLKSQPDSRVNGSITSQLRDDAASDTAIDQVKTSKIFGRRFTRFAT